mmetsp:Transcript_45312/g.51142  ORF Transcript_45312/g.51142 Transcript_45312/m.51142 type:complete len:83 (+) Transcript_45312:373-621(+)
MASVTSPMYSFCEMEMDAAKNAQNTSSATKMANASASHDFDLALYMDRIACCTSAARNMPSIKKETKASPRYVFSASHVKFS